MSTDLKFFTNDESDSLYSRFVSTIKDAQYFDVLVGYFRTSGFYRMRENLEPVEKIRILVGLNTDKKIVELVNKSNDQKEIDLESYKGIREKYSEAVRDEIENEEESSELDVAARQFIEFINQGKLEIKVHPSQNIHAKIYITRFKADDRDFGRVITGSSNFSENGLVAQREFNVELKDKADVKFALERFEELWKEGVNVSDEYIETIKNKTWFRDDITPYELYLKFLYEYFKEDLNAEKLSFELPDGFMDLAYQRQAVVSAIKILETYNGVFLSDVVGLGKTFITAMLLQQLPPGNKLVICPPVLAEYWRDTLNDFYIPGFEVISLGKLDKLLEKGVDRYKYVVIDEAHKFRNEVTQSYEMLHKICRNKKVILVSATPLNNKLDDIKTQIKLFQPLRNSTIPGIRNLEAFFKNNQNIIDDYETGSQEQLEAIKKVSLQIRDRVLKHIMVRRTRTEIKKYFSDDIEKQKLFFPEMADPRKIVYEFDDQTEAAFEKTISLLAKFSYSRYTPLIFLKDKLGEFELQSEINISGFMKSIILKRLESSFYAFKQSIQRFISIYKQFIKMYDAGIVWIGKKVNIFDLMDNDDQDKLLKFYEEEKIHKYKSSDFAPEYREKLQIDLQIIEEIHGIWSKIDKDPKIDAFILNLKKDKVLSNKIIVFTESKETANYLQAKLDIEFPGLVMSYSSEGGIYNHERISGDSLRTLIKANYEPKFKNLKNNVKILITTDVLAEGINLHISNVVINYDLPWNPTRVLQRVGRVNRVGTLNKFVYVYNFFPTSQSDAHLGLEGNIKSKLQAFHNTLGEDSKYLSDDEELSSHQLFGEKLYDKLNSKKFLEDENDEIDDDLKYLNKIISIKDNDLPLFVNIKNLPIKARTAKKYLAKNNHLLTFFREGNIKKFVISNGEETNDILFGEAAKILECLPEEEKKSLPDNYFELLKANKDYLESLSDEENIFNEISLKGSSNETEIIKIIKAIHKYDAFTDEDENYLKKLRKTLEIGSVPKNTSKNVIKLLKASFSPISILQTLKKNIPESDLDDENDTSQQKVNKEVVLNEYLAGE